MTRIIRVERAGTALRLMVLERDGRCANPLRLDIRMPLRMLMWILLGRASIDIPFPQDAEP